MKRIALGLIAALLPIGAANAQEGIYLSRYTPAELISTIRAAGYTDINCSRVQTQEGRVIGIPIPAEPPFFGYTPQCSANDPRTGNAADIFIRTNLCPGPNFDFCQLLPGGGVVAVLFRDGQFVGFDELSTGGK